MTDYLNRLAKWRTVLTGWQLGTRAKGDPEADAVRDHRESSLVMRAELTAVTAILVKKGIFTVEEFRDQVQEEARHLCELHKERFPGFEATDTGITMTAAARETTKGWKP